MSYLLENKTSCSIEELCEKFGLTKENAVNRCFIDVFSNELVKNLIITPEMKVLMKLLIDYFSLKNTERDWRCTYYLRHKDFHKILRIDLYDLDSFNTVWLGPEPDGSVIYNSNLCFVDNRHYKAPFTNITDEISYCTKVWDINKDSEEVTEWLIRKLKVNSYLSLCGYNGYNNVNACFSPEIHIFFDMCISRYFFDYERKGIIKSYRDNETSMFHFYSYPAKYDEDMLDITICDEFQGHYSISLISNYKGSKENILFDLKEFVKIFKSLS